jgi:hypothetical protein
MGLAFDHLKPAMRLDGGKSVSRLVFLAKRRHFHRHQTTAMSHRPKREKATRQQGGFFSRENSSNGGKAIRTFLAS